VLNILESGKTLLLIIIARIMPEPGSWINRRPRFWQRDLEKMTLFHHHFKLRFFPTHSALRSVVLFFALSGVAAAKNQLQIDLGVRGGTFNSGIPIEVFSNHYFPPRYSTDKIAPTFGPTVGVLINNRVGVRLEAVRSRFRFHGESTTPFPASGQKYTSTTDGHIWQYPLLVTVNSGDGPLRAFGGGGISLGRSIRGTTTTVTTRVSPLPAGVTTVTTTTEPFRVLGSGPFAFYITGGLDASVSLLSIRPELRYAHSHASLADQENQLIFSPNQFEFLVGITVHPFRFKTRQKH
jgi:hypothetical protein